MPLVPNPRVADFDVYLRTLGIPIPISGVSDNNNGTDAYPQGVSINFLGSATAEQIAQGNTALAEFDWRKRRMIARNTIVNTLAALTAAQQNAILRHICAAYIREHKAEALDLLATLQQNIPIDEVDPT